MSKQKIKKERIDKYRPPTDSFNDLVENSIQDEKFLSSEVRMSKMLKKKVREQQFTQAQEEIRDRITF